MTISKNSFFLGLAAVFVATNAEALTVSYGRPVTGIGSNTSAVATYPSTEGDAYFNPANGEIKYYIPVDGDKCPVTSGVGCIFGVTDVQPGSGVTTAGTKSDSGTGGQLTMYLRFDSVELPASTATLELKFKDLDLFGVNDPNHFFESVRFYDDNGNALTDTINDTNDDNAGVTPFTVSGNSSSQTIFFSNLTSIVESPFYLRLRFRSDWDSEGCVENTPEYFSAKLTTAAVPEPASMLLLGSGLLGVATRRRKRA